MGGQLNIQNNYKSRIVVAGMTVTIIFLLALSCAANYGSLKRSPEITKAFESYQILPDYKYYHLGWTNRPYAVVGIKQSYKIESNQWIEFDAEPNKLRKVVDAIAIFTERGYDRPLGSYIMDSEGNRIGVWYSSLLIASVQVDDASKKVSFATDQPWVRGDRFGL